MRIEELREAAWEWTGVDGNVMRGCEQLQSHAKKLTRLMTGGQPVIQAAGSGRSAGPPEDVRMRAVHHRQVDRHGGLAAGSGSSGYLVRELEGTHKEVHETNQSTKSLEMRMDRMERQMAHTHMIIEALATKQGVDIPPMPLTVDVGDQNDTWFRPIEGEPEAGDGKPEREALTPPRGDGSPGVAATPAPLPARDGIGSGRMKVTSRTSSQMETQDLRSPIRRKAEAEGRTIGNGRPSRGNQP